MLKPQDVEVLNEEERKSVDAWEQAIDARLKQGRGHADVHFDESTPARIRYELARRYLGAGWNVNHRQTGLQAQLVILHPMMAAPEGAK